MSIFRLHPRDRRQSDPFRAVPVTHTGPQPRFADPHGIATDETLADLRALAETIDWHGPAKIAPPQPYGADAPFGAGRLSPLTASVVDDLGGCVLFRDAVQAHFVRHEHTQGSEPQDGEGWLAEAARIYDARFTTELAAIEREACALEYVPEFAGELRALHAEMAAAVDDSGFWADFNAGVAEVEAGFFQARRVFHREDTAGFPAVAS